MKQTTKNLVALGISALTIGTGMGFFASQLTMTPEVIVKDKIVTMTETVEVPVEVIKEVEVPFNVTVEKIVEIDNGNLDMVLDYLEEQYGNRAIFKDASEIVSNIEFEDMLRNEVRHLIDDIWFDELDDEGLINSEFANYRDDEISLYSMDKAEDVVLSGIDYDDEEATVRIDIKVKANSPDEDSIKKDFRFTLKYDKDGFEVRDVVKL